MLDDDYLVLEAGNPRIQRIWGDGRYVDAYHYAAGSGLTSIFPRGDSQIWVGGWQSCDDGGICLLSTRLLDRDLTTVRTTLRIEETPLDVSFRFAQDEAGRVFAANVHATDVLSVGLDGESMPSVSVESESIDPFLRHIRSGASPQERLMGAVEAMRSVPHTFVAAIAAHDGRLYVQHGRSNYDDDGPRYLLDVFTFDGELLYQGIPTNGRLQGTDGDGLLLFVETLDTEPHGEARVTVGRLAME